MVAVQIVEKHLRSQVAAQSLTNEDMGLHPVSNDPSTTLQLMRSAMKMRG